MILYFYDKHFKDADSLVSAKIPYNFKTDKELIKNLKKEFSSNDYKENSQLRQKILT